ncbi:MAG TPA: hypothetical protein VHY22_12575 [Chthoniobacteraceae bacterium]|nr:hypothetical protein [Chthoniobacteraceae bacterium]
MTPPFLLLLAAAGLFRLLSSDSKAAYTQRLARLLPRNVMQDHLRVLTQEFPARLGEFRRKALPRYALHVLWNAAACACFAVALWFFPPAGMQHWDLIFVRYGSIVLTPVAFLMDLVGFVRLANSAVNRSAAPDEAV